jgi:predicted O-linked N-acetylglucosamine transferase (SPINDLY family)
MINLYIKENPCNRLILISKYFRINIIKYDENYDFENIIYPCLIAKQNIIFVKNFIKHIVNLNKNNINNKPSIICYDKNHIIDDNFNLKIIQFNDLIYTKDINIACIYIPKIYDKCNINDIFNYPEYKNFSIVNKTLGLPVKVNENTNFSQTIPNSLHRYCIFNNTNKYEYNIIKNKMFITDIDWISFFKKNIINEEFTIFVIFNNNIDMIPIIKNNHKFFKIIIYNIDYELYDLISKKKYILCNNFKLLVKLLKMFGFNSKIIFIDNTITNNKLNKLLQIGKTFYKDDDCFIFKSYQLYLMKFFDKRFEYNNINFLRKYIKNLNTTNNIMVINDFIIKKCYDKSLFYVVDDIIEILYKHKHLDSEYYYSKKLSILFYTRRIGQLNNIKLKNEDLNNNNMLPLIWLTSKHFGLNQDCLNDLIKFNSTNIINSYILMEQLELKRYDIFKDNDIADNIISHLKNNNNLSPKIKEICTNILLFNTEYIKSEIGFSKKKYNCNLDEIVINKNVKKNFLKYGFPLFVFHSHMPQFINSMDNILNIRNLSLNFFKELNKNIDDSIKIKIKKDIQKYNIFEMVSVTTNFAFSYHGINSKNLFINRNNIVELYIKEKYNKVDMNYHFDKKNIKKRIGFLSNFLTRKHSVFKDRHQVIKGLSEMNEYDIYVITFDNFQPVVKDNFNKCKHIKLVTNYEKDVKTIRNLNLDCLVFCEIGMDPRAYYMAFNQLAKMEINTWGHSDTSGISRIDYFLSSTYYEDEQSMNNYSEKLILLDSLCTCYVNPSKNKILNKKLYHYSLFDNQKIILCNQSLFKILPIFDDYILDILKNNRNSIIVLIDIKNLRIKFMERISKKCNELQILNRINIIDHGYPHNDFLNLVKLSYIQLDVYPFGGCNSSLECLEQGIPIITQESKMLNGRFTTGFYKKINLTEMVAKNKKEYIKITNKLLNNKKYYNDIIEKIKNSNHNLFMEKKSINTWYDFIKQNI